MAIISRLGVVLGLDSGEFNAGLGQAKSGLNSFSIDSGIAKAGIAALGTALVAASYQAITFADGINDIAKANDMAVGKVLEFSQALSTNGGKAENASKLLSAFTNKIDEAATGSQKTRDKFKELGISLNDLGKLSETDLLRKTIDGLAKIEDPIKRNAMAFDVLGRGVRGVDIKGLNEELQRINGTMDGSDEKFAKIGDALDRLDRLSIKLKTDFANNIAEPVSVTSQILEKFYDQMKVGNDILDEQSKKLEKYGVSFKNIFLGGVMQTLRLGQVLNGIKNNQKDDGTGKYTPQTDTTNYKPDFNVSNSPRRATPLSDEDIKRATAAEKISQAMRQQTLEYKRQIEFVGKIETFASKVALEFKEGGKYAGQQNTELGKRLLAEAKSLDTAKLRYAGEEAIRKVLEEHSKLRDKADEDGKRALAAVIERRQAEKEAFDLATQDVQIAAERLDYEKQLAGLSDTQREKALEFFDLSRKMKRMAEQEIGLDVGQLEKRQQAEQERITSSEENKRAQKTFQAGWDRAYNNFVERAKDSAAIGASAFNNMASNMTSALDTFVETGKISFSSLISSMIKDLLKMQLQAQASGFFSQLVSSAFGAFGASKGTSGSLGKTDLMGSGIGFAAEGGYIDKPTIVGERGMELFIPKSPGTVIPNNALASMMGSQPQVVYNGTVVQNMSAIDTQSATQFLARNKQAVWASNMSAQRSLPMSR